MEQDDYAEEITNDNGLGPHTSSAGQRQRNFIAEARILLALAWPTSLSILFHFFVQPVSLMFCGRLGDLELSSAAMALSVINITVVSIGRGLAFAGDTFFSQTFGSSNKFGVGIYLQKALLFGLLCSCVICAFLINTENILLLLHQNPVVARMAQSYTETFAPGVLAYCWAFTMMRYLICQNKVMPNLVVCAIGCASNALLHDLLLDQNIQLGLRGSAISLAVTYYIVFILLVAYVYCSGFYVNTWQGWSIQSLQEWAPFSWVAIPSIVMTFLFWLSTELGTFLAGLLGTEEVSAFSICFQVEGLAWVIPLGVGSACTTRVGQLLGARKPRRAITSCKVALAIQIFCSIALSMVCCSCRYYIPKAFTNDQSLIRLTAELLPYVSVFLLLEGCGGIGVSIIRGTGRQATGAVILFVSYYVFALPVGITVMFITPLRMTGLWLGYILGLVVQNLFLLYYILHLDWEDQANDAQIRAGMVADNPSIRRANETASGESGRLFNDSASSHESDSLLGVYYQPPASDLLGTYYYQSLASIQDEISGPSVEVVQRRTILRRLVTLGAVCIVLAAGIVCRTVISIPRHDNSTLPWWNVTSHGPFIRVPLEPYGNRNISSAVHGDFFVEGS